MWICAKTNCQQALDKESLGQMWAFSTQQAFHRELLMAIGTYFTLFIVPTM